MWYSSPAFNANGPNCRHFGNAFTELYATTAGHQGTFSLRLEPRPDNVDEVCLVN